MDERSTFSAMARGMKQTCPACGQGTLYKNYLKVADTCPKCCEALHHQRADDAPAYFTILIVAHIVGAGILITESVWHPADWVQWIIWIPTLLILSLLLLPRIKGALIGIQWAQRMHGFGGSNEGAAFGDPPVKKAPV